LFGVLIAAVAASAPDTSPLDVQMTLSSNTILLGEPLWVDVRVTNRSSVPLSVDMGNACFGAKPLSIDVPDAQRLPDKTKRCGIVEEGGSCLTQVPQAVAPGETLTKRYLFAGDFRITHAGRYTVRLTKPLRYGTLASTPAPIAPGIPGASPSETAIVETTLTVLPANPEKLLEIERGLIAHATATWPPGIYNPTALALKGAANRAIMEGVVTYPAVGLEPLFNSWLAGPGANYNATAGLYHLNTTEAREDLARFIETLPNRNTVYLRDEAIDDLGNMGDVSYLPLLERFAEDRDFATRQWAVGAVASLGGDAAVAALEAIAVHPLSPQDRNDAITALGETASVKAVPVLLSLFDGTLESAEGVSFSLFLLTHHQLAASESISAQYIETAWKMWWAQNATTARIYHSWEDCPDEKAKSVNAT
jgi:hypothetical protein